MATQVRTLDTSEGVCRVLCPLDGAWIPTLTGLWLTVARMEEELLRLRKVLESCSFCGVYKFKTRKLISSPRQTWICDGCVTLGRRVLESGAAEADERARLKPADPDVRCRFCGAGARGEKLVTGGGTNICASCLDLCDEILTENHRRGS